MKADQLKRPLDLALLLFEGFNLIERILDVDDEPNATLAAVETVILTLRRGIDGVETPDITKAAIDELIAEQHAKQSAMRAASDQALTDKFEKK